MLRRPFVVRYLAKAAQAAQARRIPVPSCQFQRKLTTPANTSQPPPSPARDLRTNAELISPISPDSAAAVTTERTSNDSPSVGLTDACVSRLQALTKQRDGTVILRVTVDAGGCSGFQYNFKLEDWPSLPTEASMKGEDVLIARDGAAVIVDTLSLEYLAGSKVDYLEEMISSSFRVVDNPNSEASCGCGTSFAPKM